MSSISDIIHSCAWIRHDAHSHLVMANNFIDIDFKSKVTDKFISIKLVLVLPL